MRCSLQGDDVVMVDDQSVTSTPRSQSLCAADETKDECWTAQ